VTEQHGGPLGAGQGEQGAAGRSVPECFCGPSPAARCLRVPSPLQDSPTPPSHRQPWQLCAGTVWGSICAVVWRGAPSTAPDTTHPPSHNTYLLPFISSSSSSQCTLAQLLALFPHFGKFPLLVLPQSSTFYLGAL